MKSDRVRSDSGLFHMWKQTGYESDIFQYVCSLSRHVRYSQEFHFNDIITHANESFPNANELTGSLFPPLIRNVNNTLCSTKRVLWKAII